MYDNAMSSFFPFLSPMDADSFVTGFDCRGLVVTVYANPPYSFPDDLYKYETGQYGCILP